MYFCKAPKHSADGANKEFVKLPRLLLSFMYMFPFSLFSLTLLQSIVHFKHQRGYRFQPTDENIFFDTLRAMETRSRSYGDSVSKMGLLSPIFQKP